MKFTGLMGLIVIATGLGAMASCLLVPTGANAQNYEEHGRNISVKQYIREAGGVAKYVAPGRLRLAGQRVLCGRRPSILDPEFDTWAGAYTNPGFIIVNPIYMSKERKAVQLYIYAHECGHQFRGFDEDTADAFAVRRGVRQGWLSRTGMKQVCRFISRVPGDAEHPAGPKRCQRMKRVYKDIVMRHNRAILRRSKTRRKKARRAALGFGR